VRDCILIAGLGSIGRRHLANLQTLGWRRIRLYRTGRSTLPDAEMRHFLACLRDEEQPLCALRNGRAALEVALAAKRAIAAGKDLVQAP